MARMRPRRLLLLSLAPLVITVAAGGAFANGAALPDTLAVSLRPGSTKEIGLETNFGWLTSRNDKPFTWVCHEAVLPPTSQLTPYFYLAPNATYVTVRSIGQALQPEYSLFRSLDGCSFVPPTDLQGINVREVAVDPSDGDRALATTFNGSGASNGVWMTEDNGETWEATLFLPNRFFRSVKFSRANPQRVWATATWFSPTPQAWIYRSDDGGFSWDEIPWTFAVGTTLQGTIDVAAVSPTDGNVAYMRTNGGWDYLLRTEDGGDTWSVVFEIAEDIRGVTVTPEGDRVWIATAGSGLFVSTDGRTFDELETAVSSRGVAADDRGLWVVANNYTQFALGHSTDQGATFTNVFRFHEIASPRLCPADSDVALRCEPLWGALVERFGITTTPTPTPPGGDDDDDDRPADPFGCSCSLAAGAMQAAPIGALALALLIGASVRIRRRRMRDAGGA